MKAIYALLFFLLSSISLLKAQDSLSLYIFLLDDCPICLEYTQKLNELHKEYGDQIHFIGYFPNFSSKPEKIETFKVKYAITFPLQSDYYKKQALKWKARVTPEVILFNHSTDKIIYQGRIDNKFVKLGRRRNVVTEDNLRLAIIATLMEDEVDSKYAEPIGCFINYNDNIKTESH